MKASKKEVLMVAVIVIIQTIIFVIAGINKAYIHMDEAFSYGLTNFDKFRIQMNDDFYNKWHNKDYYADYLVVNEDEKYDFSRVYINQKNDVHPPLYYLLLRIGMGFHVGQFSKWSGLILNIIIYAFITIFMYLIIKELLNGESRYKEKSAILALISALTITSINNAIYIRMYALSTLNVAITTYLHLRLLKSKELDYKLLCFIGLSALAGSLTHYYYLFYLFMLFVMFVIKYIKEKRYKELKSYIITMVIAGGVSLAIFPYSVVHMFFGYRGTEALGNMFSPISAFKGFVAYGFTINKYVFNNLLGIILLAIFAILIYKKIKKIKIVDEKNEGLKYLLLPMLFYLVLVILSAPWKDLRYIAPVCPILFILVILALARILKNLVSEKVLNIIISVLFIVMLIMPYPTKIKIPVQFKNYKEIVEKLSNELNLPSIYVMRSYGNRFLDDILLFAKLDESYIAQDIECKEDELKEIFDGKDISKGIIVFINEGQNNSEILRKIKDTFGFEKSEHLKRLNAADVYYLK